MALLIEGVYTILILNMISIIGMEIRDDDQ